MGVRFGGTEASVATFRAFRTCFCLQPRRGLATCQLSGEMHRRKGTYGDPWGRGPWVLSGRGRERPRTRGQLDRTWKGTHPPAASVPCSRPPAHLAAHPKFKEALPAQGRVGPLGAPRTAGTGAGPLDTESLLSRRQRGREKGGGQPGRRGKAETRGGEGARRGWARPRGGREAGRRGGAGPPGCRVPPPSAPDANRDGPGRPHSLPPPSCAPRGPRSPGPWLAALRPAWPCGA